MRRLLPALLLAAAIPGVALAGNGFSSKAPIYNSPVDANGNALGTDANPYVTRSPAQGNNPQPDVTGSGTIAAATVGSAYTVTTNNQGTARFSVTGLSARGATLQAQYTADGGTTWEPIAALRPPLAYSTAITADGQYEVKASATTGLRLIVTTAGTAGTINVASVLTNTQGLVGLVGPLPPGTNAIGTVGVTNNGTFVVQNNAAIPTGANLIGKVGIDQTTPGTTNGVVIVEATAISGDASITTGGTAQTLFGGTAPPNGWSVSNPNLSDDLWCSDSTTAAVNGQGSFRIAANGGSHETPPLSKPAGPVSCVGPTTGDKITARRW